ncbi:MAG: hypothetical protein P1V20_30430 [Verrucomicrobiales bacterium]|nr:hypothetical protein [Verrucomicrobiales bacterium]
MNNAAALSFLLISLILGPGVAVTFGQEDSSFADLTAKYEAAVARVKKQYGEEKNTLTNRFLNAWLKAEEELQQAGNLEELLAAKKARESFMENGTLGSGGSEKFSTLREVYMESLRRIEGDEAKAIQRFNSTYCTALEKMAVALTKANKIDEAIAIKKIIDQKTEQNKALQMVAAEDGQTAKPPIGSTRKKDDDFEMETFLVGKTFGFPRQDGVEVYYSFQEDGKALWLGPGNQAIERAYKTTKKPRQIFIWWPERGIDGIGRATLTVEQDGVTAEIYEFSPDRTTKGKLSKSI